MVKLSPSIMVTAALVIVMFVAFLGMLVTLIPTGATSVHNLSDALSGQGEVLGTGAATFAGTMDDNTGWFWVIGPFAFIAMAIIGIFIVKGRSRGRRYRRY